ncbi:MAG TPA: ATP synthase F0 subunit B [Pseudobdellovibrionaceae bacterium]|nr:ATP synthase F0 subunit B [Pseudobdellovibrionaceae bacterium]
MDLLHALGINQYAIVQFLIFAVMFAFLTGYVFTPYAKALDEREKRTVGGENLAEEYQEKAIELQAEYQTKARDLNAQIQAIFQTQKGTASAEQEALVRQARDEANALIEKNRQVIAKSVSQVSEELRGQTTNVALAITNRLLGK